MTTTEITLRKKQVSKLAALWLGDLHLDKAGDQQRKKLYNKIHSSKSDCVIITGDIASARHLRGHLMDFLVRCLVLPVHPA